MNCLVFEATPPPAFLFSAVLTTFYRVSVSINMHIYTSVMM